MKKLKNLFVTGLTLGMLSLPKVVVSPVQNVNLDREIFDSRDIYREVFRILCKSPYKKPVSILAESVYNLIGSIGWSIITLGFGYFFGGSFKYVFKYIANATMLMLGLCVVGLIIYFIFKFVNKSVVRALEIGGMAHDLGDKMIINIDKFLAADEDGGPVRE